MNLIANLQEMNLNRKLRKAFGKDLGMEFIDTLKEGYLTAQQKNKLDLWQIRNQGYGYRTALDWSISETEDWINKHQEFYKKGYDFFYESKGNISPRFPGSPFVEHVMRTD